LQNQIPGHADEPVQYAQLMENIWDWKGFITPHLQSSRSVEFIGMSEPHHFRFFQRNNVPHVQYKIYANDAWGPSDGHPFLASLPDVRGKPGFAEVFQANTEEVAALHSFSSLKERQVHRHIRLNAVDDVIQMYHTVIVETKAFIEYLQEFPNSDRTLVHASAKFWWTTPQNKASDENASGEPNIIGDMTEILSCFPAVEHRGYFGPRGGAPTKQGLQRPVPKNKKDAASKYIAKASKLGSTSTDPISNAVPAQHQRWFDFDPHMDVHIGDFVGVHAPKSARRNGELFWVAKVREVQKVAREDGEFLALWYWPTKPKGLRDGSDAMRARYVNSLARTWEPDRMYKGQDWIAVNSVFVSWMQSTKLKADLLTVQGYRTEKKISIPLEQHSHFENHLSLLQDTGSEDDHME
jgi:hypothetical protein